MALKSCVFFLCFATLAAWAAEPTAPQVAERLDILRRPTQSFEAHLSVTEMHNGKTTHESVMRVMARKHPDSLRFDAVALCLEPAADRGKALLVTNHEIWFQDPRSKHPTQISPQHLRAKYFVSDALSTSFSADYESEIVGEETIQDASRSNVLCLRLRMKRNEKGSAAEAIDFWVDKKTLHPIKSESFSGNGKLLRTAYYAGYAKVLGETRPTRILVVSNTERGVITDIQLSEFSAHEWPEEMYNKTALERVCRGELP